MNDEELRKLYLLLSKACSVVTAGKDANGKISPNQTANTFLLGDGLIVAQNNGEPGAWSSAVRGLVAASYFLFENGFPHRDVIMRGSFVAESGLAGPPVIFGTGVVKVIQAERKVKTVGIVLDRSLDELWPRWNLNLGDFGEPLRSQSFGNSFFLTSTKHRIKWKEYCDQNHLKHPYTAAAKLLLESNNLWSPLNKPK